MKKYAKLGIVPLGLALISFGTLKISRLCWDSLVRFRAPEFRVEPGPRAAPVSRVVLVVVDGLRVDAFERMTYLASLKEKGASFILKTGQPSLSNPASAVILTGAWQDVTGVTTNWFVGPVRQDSLFSLAKDAGLTTALAGGAGWRDLVGDAVTWSFARKWKNGYNTFDEETLARTLEFLSEGPDFCLVHFIDTDEAGHDFGALSPEYRRAADHIDGLIEKLHRGLGRDTVLIVTSDHGRVDRGGHGGWEAVVTHVPLLLYGNPVKPGSYGTAEQTDIAPTVSALLGLPVPPYSQGRILAEALNLGGEEARLLKLQAEHKEVFARAYLGAIGVDFEKARREVGPAPREEDGRYWDRVLAKGKAEKIAAGRLRRIPLFLAVLAVPLLLFWFTKKRLRFDGSLPWLLAIIFFAVDYGLFFASGKTFSLSSVNHDLIRRFFNEAMLYAGVSAVLMAAALGLLDRGKTLYETAKGSVALAALVACLIIVQIDVFFLYNGPLITWYIPDMFLALKYYLDLLSLVVIGFLSAILPLVSLGAHRVVIGSSKDR